MFSQNEFLLKNTFAVSSMKILGGGGTTPSADTHPSPFTILYGVTNDIQNKLKRNIKLPN